MDVTKSQKIEIENVMNPGHIVRVDADKYERHEAGVSEDTSKDVTRPDRGGSRGGHTPHLPEDLFPQGAKAGWWKKAVQLDLEAKGVIAREKTKPLRWHKR